MDEMPSHEKGYFRINEIPKKVFVLYIIILLVVSFSPMVCLSDAPGIIVNSPSNAYTNRSYVNISVSISDTEEVSSFINWNGSLVGYWNFEYMNSSGVHDNSTCCQTLGGHSNHGNFNGTLNTNNQTDGKYGYGFSFNGSSDSYLDCGNDSSLDITDEITIEAWIKEYETTFNKTFDAYCLDVGDMGNVAAQQTSDGGYILVGRTYSAANLTDILLIKTDSNGNVLWNNTFGGNNNDSGACVQETSDGGYIIVGYYNSIDKSAYDDSMDIWLIKTNSTGYEGPNDSDTWNKTFGEDGYRDRAYSVQQTNDSGYIITGYKYNGSDDCDLWLIKTNSTGYEGPDDFDTWNKTFGETGSGRRDYGYSVQQTNDSGFIVTGRTRSYGASSNDLWLLKVDYSGNNEMINKIYGGSGSDYGWSVQQTNDSGYIITGYTKSFGGSDKDIWLLKVDYSGNNEMINKTFGGSQDDTGLSVQQTSDGGYIITGYTKSYSSVLGKHDLWLLKVDYSGNNEMINGTYGGFEEADYGWSVQQTTDDGYIIAGQYNLSGDIGLWLLKTDANGNLTESNNNQSLNKIIVGKGTDAYQMQLYNGTISGYIGNSAVNSSQQNLSNLTRHWHHIALTYDGSNMRLYINGTLINLEPSSASDINTNNVTIGKNFSGIIDEIRIWNRVLSEDEINASYNCLGPYYRNFTGLSEGNYNYSLYAIDSNGNENETDTQTIILDTTAPTSSMTTLSTYKNTDFTVEWSAVDAASGVASYTVEYRENASGAWTAWLTNVSYLTTSSTWEISNTTEGCVVYFRALAVDNASNCGSWSDSINTTKDTTAPTSNINTILPHVNNTGVVNLTATADDSLSDIKNVTLWYNYSSDNSSWSGWIQNTTETDYNWNWTFTFPNNTGYYEFYSIAYDNATNIESVPGSADARCRYTTNNAPSVTNPSPSNGATGVSINRATINATISDTDGDNVNWTIETRSDIGNSSWTDTGENNTCNYSKICNVSGLSKGITYTWWVNVTDGDFWTNATYTFTTEEETSGGGGGGNTVVHDDEEEITNTTTNETEDGTQNNTANETEYTPEQVKQTLLNITTNETYQVNFTLNNTIIVKVEFKSNNNLQNVNFTIEENEEKPNSVSKEPTKEEIQEYLNITIENITIYRYIDINTTANDTYVEEIALQQNKIRFKVNKTWIINNSITNITLLRYHNNTWEILNTIRTNETEEYIVFEAETPGFSTFAVVGSKVVEKGEKYNPKEPIPWIIIIGFILLFSTVLIIVLFKAKYIYIEKE